MADTSAAKDLKILFESAAPFYPTAYGTQSLRTVRFLLDHGFDIKFRATTHSGQEYRWEGIDILPSSDGAINDSESHYHQVKKYRRNVWIPHFDYWWFSMDVVQGMHKAGVLNAPRMPLDHDPIDLAHVQRLQESDLCIVESRFAEKEVRRVLPETGCPPTYVPVSIDAAYRPYPKQDDVFRVLMVKNNVGPRPNFPGLLKAFAAFVRKHGLSPEEAELLLWTQTRLKSDATGEFGHNLGAWAWMLGIEDYVKYPRDHGLELGLSEERMARDVYSQASVHVNSCGGESVGVPIIEAGSCGVPSLAVDWSGSAEHTIPECRIPVGMPFGVQVGSDWGLLDDVALSDMLSELYLDPVKARKLGARCREHSEQYRAEVVLPQWLPVMDSLAEMRRVRNTWLWGDMEPEVMA